MDLFDELSEFVASVLSVYHDLEPVQVLQAGSLFSLFLLFGDGGGLPLFFELAFCDDLLELGVPGSPEDV